MDRDTVFAYVRENYGIEPDYPWTRYPTNAVLRHRENRKWFGLVMDVPREKLGIAGAGAVTLVNVKADHGIVYLSKDTPGIMPAYHMNKENWLSVLLDGTVPDGIVFELLDESHGLTR